MAGRRLTQAQFDKVKGEFSKMSDENLEIARLNLVEGYIQEEAGAQFGAKLSRTQRACKRVYDKYMSLYERCPKGYVKISLCLPNEKIATKYESMAADEITAYRVSKGKKAK